MKYPDINIQIKYPNKLINADTPSVWDLSVARNSRETRFLHRRNGRTDKRTDGRMDGRTDRLSYRDAFLTDASKNTKTARQTNTRTHRHYIMSSLINLVFVISGRNTLPGSLLHRKKLRKILDKVSITSGFNPIPYWGGGQICPPPIR